MEANYKADQLSYEILMTPFAGQASFEARIFVPYIRSQIAPSI